ncbi:MAG: rhomboid family intramembrane serine protease [Limisphaerales bacterium]
MNRLWHRFLASLTPGVRILLCLWSAVYLAAAIGKFSHAYDLARWLAVSGPNFWHGQVWELITYPLLPTTVLDFVFNSLMIVLLGGLLERIWARADFWTYCAVAAVGAGLAKVFLQSSNPFPMTGMAPVVFGLLAAWGYLSGHEKVPFVFFGEMTVWQMVLLAGAVSFFTTLFSTGLVNAIIMLAGGLTGLLYLWLRSKILMTRESRIVHSERINRLEL